MTNEQTGNENEQETSYRVLAIHAHPDDIEFQCAGTLALLNAQGHHITMVTMTAGDCGSRDLSPEAIAKVRRQEAKSAADMLDAHYECLEFHDLSIVVDNESKRRVAEAIRRARPDIVFTAPPADYMEDHEATSRLVREACFSASCPNYATRQWEPAPATEKIPILYYVDPLDAMDLWGNQIEPHFYIDIQEVFEKKKEMLACHESQRAWLRAQHGVDEYLEMLERFGKDRGEEVGLPYAEAFRQHLGHPYPHNDLLKTLLSSHYYTKKK
ncbi:N-acetylglucosaminylphosphatidylinositol deacetylase [Planctomycetales bacterium 10988]|nr:N-acetylglucosaminylphosphatidylinositol deacetylase [Planctomycetales bacterium 10988]